MLRYWTTRATNSLRKVASGLRPWNESVWPGVRNDLFVGHESIYRFFAQYVAYLRVVDAGCGTGYGSHYLATQGAESVVGVDLDSRSVRFARRHYEAPNLSFRVGDIEVLELPPASADLVVASNSLEHLESPEKFLHAARKVAPTGTLILAVPPILTAEDLAAHSGIEYHRSNLHYTDWVELLRRQPYGIKCFAHRPAGVWRGDFSSPFPSTLTQDDFVIVESSPEDLLENGAITAIFVLEATDKTLI